MVFTENEMILTKVDCVFLANLKHLFLVFTISMTLDLKTLCLCIFIQECFGSVLWPNTLSLQTWVGCNFQVLPKNKNPSCFFCFLETSCHCGCLGFFFCLVFSTTAGLQRLGDNLLFTLALFVLANQCQAIVNNLEAQTRRSVSFYFCFRFQFCWIFR